MARIFKNEFSWSVSRWQQFQYCKRAYYYNYYGSWGGWEREAPDRVRQLYILKNMKTLLMWAGIIVHDLIKLELEQYSRGEGLTPLQGLKDRARQLLRQGWIESVSKEWLNNPKKTNLFELYYGDGKSLPKEETDYVRDRIYNCLEAFHNSPYVKELLEVPFLQWKSIDELNSFQLGGTKVWGAIDFAYTDAQGKLHIIDWKTGGENPPALRLQLACYALLAMDKWKVNCEDLHLQGIFLNDGGRKSDYPIEAETLMGAKEQILQSIENMKLALQDRENNLAEEENFPLSGYPHNCESCNFRQACPVVSGSGARD